jgi:hypothetical protein
MREQLIIEWIFGSIVILSIGIAMIGFTAVLLLPFVTIGAEVLLAGLPMAYAEVVYTFYKTS